MSNRGVSIIMAAPVDELSRRQHRRGLLKQYYGLSDMSDGHTMSGSGKVHGGIEPAHALTGGSDIIDVYNINGPDFNPEMYLDKLLKECSLTELMDREQEMYKQIQSLDSEMQTLVYENYNKFISATDTIRKMKNDFKKMEEEMDLLATNMAAITDFSGKISNTLQGHREELSKLTGTHALLKKLQFLFELPKTLKNSIESGCYVQAVRDYAKAQRVLEQYQHMQSFQGIQDDCEAIVAQLKERLRDQFKARDATSQQLAECVDLLLQLNEPAEQLCEEFLSHARQKLDVNLTDLEHQVRLHTGDKDKPPANLPVDVLEFVDLGCNDFVGSMCLVIAAYSDMFLNRIVDVNEAIDGERLDDIAMRKLINFVSALMSQFFSMVEQRVLAERETGDNAILVRALDRFHRRLQAMNKLLPGIDFSRTAVDIVSKSGKDRCDHCLQAMKRAFSDRLTDVRLALAAPRAAAASSSSTSDGTGSGSPSLPDLVSTLQNTVATQIKMSLSNLQAFIQPDVTFAAKPHFKDTFCEEHVREGLVADFFRYTNATCLEFCSLVGERGGSPPPALLLVLSRFCLNVETAVIEEMFALTDEHFGSGGTGNERLTAVSDLRRETRDCAQKLLNHFVSVQGLRISQMLRKSVETRDWLNTVEPRTVRAVMKRVVEDVTAIDGQVGQLFEEGPRKKQNSDSSRQPHRSNWSSYGPSTIDNSLMSNIQKLFSERIEIFSAVEFSKVSVMTGIMKISLKTFLECVRLRTFSRYGLQQVQVDTQYLQLYLWQFVSDENLVHVLLDEILVSTAHRCIDPVMMEGSVVDVICDHG